MKLQRRTRTAGVLVAAILMIGASVSSPAQAGGLPDELSTMSRMLVVGESATPPSDEEIERQDMAAAMGAPDASIEFNILATEIETNYGEQFASARYEAATGGGEITFRGDVPAEAIELALANPAIVLTGGAGYSAAEINAYSSRLLEVLAAEVGVAGATMTVSPDFESRTIALSVGRYSPEAASLPDLTSLVTQFTESVSPPGDFSLNVNVSDEPVVVLEAYDGGRVLAGVCTGAFSIKQNGTDRLGVLTAGHCPGTGSYDGVSNAFYGPQPYSLATTTSPPGGDFRWNHSKHMFTGYTYVGSASSSRRQISTSALASLDSPVCGYGKTTGYKCSTVHAVATQTAVTVPAADGGGTYMAGPFRCTKSHITDGGDSGGPWFNGSVAYGIHSGRYKWDRGTTTGYGSCWSNVTYALQRFGVTLWVG